MRITAIECSRELTLRQILLIRAMRMWVGIGRMFLSSDILHKKSSFAGLIYTRFNLLFGLERFGIRIGIAARLKDIAFHHYGSGILQH